MMRINLLPTKVRRRENTAQRELMVFGAVLASLIGVMVVVTGITAGRISAWKKDVATAKASVEAQKKDIERAQELKKNAETLEVKLGVIESLKNKRTGPTHVLDQLANILTQQRKVWLTKIEEKDGVLVLEGGAMEHENISDFQSALSKVPAGLFKNVKLSVVAAKVTDGVAHLEWKMTMTTNYSAG